MHDPLHTTTKTRDTENTPHTFLNHNGVETTLHIPLTRDYPPRANDTIPHIHQTRSIRFQFSIPQPFLTQWKKEVRGAREHTASLVHTDLTDLLSTINTPADSATPSSTTPTSDHMKTQILESANTIKYLLEEVLRIENSLFSN
jgi:hypothetical protein